MEFTVNQQTGRLRRDLCGSSTVLASSSRPVIAIPASAPVVSTAALRPTQQFGSLGAYVDGVASWPQETWRQMKRTQSSDGSWSADSWTARMVGPIYVTACYLTIMQLDKAALPIYQR